LKYLRQHEGRSYDYSNGTLLMFEGTVHQVYSKDSSAYFMFDANGGQVGRYSLNGFYPRFFDKSQN
jgi:hypothetical protein